MFNVLSRRRNTVVAVIAYDWESEAFYARWFHHNDTDIIREIKGHILNPGSDQSELAPALLNVVREKLLADPMYVERLKLHYWMFKEKVDPKHFKASARAGQYSSSTGKARRRHKK